MPQAKKRLSKAAKAAKKILEESKLLATAKADNESNSDQPFKSESSTIKPAGAHKVRPDKKRG